MKLAEEFRVGHATDAVWAFFERPRDVAACMPGVEAIEDLGDDRFAVTVRQKVGPISATFGAKVSVTEKQPPRQIRMVSIGETLRGAPGNFRSELVVRLTPETGQTRVAVEGDVALAGVLGSVGQSLVERRAHKLSQEFAGNLERALGADLSDASAGPDRPAMPVAPVASGASGRAQPAIARKREDGVVNLPVPTKYGAEFWAKTSSALSGATLAVVLIILGSLIA